MVHMQAEVNSIFDKYPLDVPAPDYHPIISFVASMMENTKNKMLVFPSLQTSEIARLCQERAKTSKDPKEILNKPNLTGLLPRIPEKHRWWLPPSANEGDDEGTLHSILLSVLELLPIPACIGMADPDPEGVARDDEDAPESPMSPNNRSMFAATPEPKDVNMDDINDGETPCWQIRSAKRAQITSPGNDAPPRQCQQVEVNLVCCQQLS